VSGFVALDGPDGCGKSTQAERLVAALRMQGRDVVHLREPGSTPFGERLRAALLDPAVGGLDPLSEALAFSAARRQMLVREVAPALARGAVVVAERCFLSTVVYQCRAPESEAAPEDLVRRVTEAVHRDAWHDLIVVLDAPAEVVRARLVAARSPDRIEALGERFHERVRRGFVDLAAADSWPRTVLARPGDAVEGRPRVVRLDATGGADQVHAAVLEAAMARLAGTGGRR
jgi:dTMP kinase